MRNNKQILKIFKRKAIAFILIFFAIFTSRLKGQGVDVIFYLDNSGSIDATEWANMSNSTKALIDDVLECNVNNRVAVVHFTGIDRDPQISTDPRIYIESNFTNNATAAKNFLKRGSSIGTHMPAMGNRTFTYENTVLLNYALGSGAPSSQIVSSQKNLTRNPNNQLVIFTFTDSPRGYHESAGAVNGNGFVRYFGSGGEFDIYNQMKRNLKATFVILHAPTNDPTEDILARRAGATVASVGGSYTGSLYANPGDPQGSGVKPRKAVMSDDFDISSINIETIAENICKSCAPTVTINTVTPPTQSICLNGTAQPLVSDAVGTGTLSYQWYQNTTNSNTGGTPISGAVSNTYQPSTSIAGTSYYYVVVSDSYCEGISYSPVVSVTIDDQGMCRPCPGPDSDGDGIPDYCDLDDDNDGILDTNEGVVDNDHVLEWGYNGTGDTPSIFNSTVISAAQNVTKGSGLTSQIFGIETSYSVSGVGATTISQAINNNSYFQFKFTTANFPNTMQYLYDRFSLWVRDASVYPTYKMRLYLSTDNFVTRTDISGEVAYPIVSYDQRVVFPLALPYSLEPNKIYTLRLYFYNVSGGASTTFNHDDFRVLTMQYKDTDSDGIPDYLDLDSDNDGCLDALEGGNNLAISNLVNAGGTVTVGLGSTATNQNLVNTVDANGVPTIVNGGQSVGSSANALVKAASCAIDLSVTKTDGKTSYIPGTINTYTIVVKNNSPFGVVNASVVDNVPAGIPAANVTYTAVASTGSTTNVVGTRTGAINDLVSLPANGTVTYTVVINIPTTFMSNLVNTVTITPPANSSDSNMANNTATDTDVSSACYKPAATVGTITETKHGITSLGRAGAENGNWPMVRNNAWTVLESKTKGFVINRISTTAAIVALPNPLEGMMVYDEQADCLKINTDGTSGGWKCFNTQTCP